MFLIAEFRKVMIVGDSIIKNLPPIEGVQLRSFPGATIGKLLYWLENGKISLKDVNYVIIHVGTNNIANGFSVDSMSSDFANLIAKFRKLSPALHIIVSSILPRPVDHESSDKKIREINTKLEKSMSKDLNFKFVRSYRPFCYGGEIKRYLFAKRDGGLHLNSEGSSRLKHFFHRVISTLPY